ncbi:uncharacterized protein TNCV_642221 [Trichonephila clavipes]|nr:uncharacterized protein TNCV_642221 [Trichonephila clavipes]
MLISGSQSELKRMQFAAEVDGNIRVSMTSRKRMEDSQRWRAVGRIEAGQSITDVALFFGAFIILSFNVYGNNSKQHRQLSKGPWAVAQGLQPPRKIDILLLWPSGIAERHPHV